MKSCIRNFIISCLFIIVAPTYSEVIRNTSNIVTRVINAPVAANGIIEGQPAEFQIWLNAINSPSEEFDADPNYFGHQIPAGGQMEIELGGAFLPNPDWTGNLKALFHCAILTGHQHNPIVPAASTVGTHHGNWELLTLGSQMKFAFKPLGGNGKNGLEGDRAKKIGVKLIHCRPDPRPFVAGTPNKTPWYVGTAGGVGTVTLKIVDSMGRVLEQGHGSVVMRKSLGRVIGLNNLGIAREVLFFPEVYNDLIESMDFQHVPPAAMLSLTERIEPNVAFFSQGFYALRFMLMEQIDAVTQDEFFPFSLIANMTYVIDANMPWKATLMENGVIAGAIVLKGPDSTNQGQLLPSPGPTTSQNTSRLIVPVQVGDMPGIYTVAVTLLGGNTETAHIIVDVKSSSYDSLSHAAPCVRENC